MKRIFGEKRRGLWLVVLGAALGIFALAMLLKIPSLAQYIGPAPVEIAADEAENAPVGPSRLRAMVDLWEANRGEIGEGASAMDAVLYGAYFDSSAAQSVQGTLTAAGSGWFDVYPRFLTEGRLFSDEEHELGKQVIVLDEDMAFKLFPTTAATEGRVNVAGEWFEVIGVVRMSASAGDSDECGAIIPLMAAARLGIQTDYVQLSCAADTMGPVRAMESVGQTVVGKGNLWHTDKEVMRATMIMRVCAIVLGLYLLGFILGRWNRRTAGLIMGWNEEVLRRYFKSMLPGVIAKSLLQLLGYACIAAAAFGLLRLIIAPMYMFTEWIPEVIVEWNKIMARFEGLITTAAQPVRYQTREYAAIKFYGALVRWSVITMLMGLMLMKKWDIKKKGSDA